MRYERLVCVGAVVLLGMWTVLASDAAGDHFGLSVIKHVSGGSLVGGTTGCTNINSTSYVYCTGTDGTTDGSLCKKSHYVCDQGKTKQTQTNTCKVDPNNPQELCQDSAGKCEEGYNNTVVQNSGCSTNKLPE